jgi:Tol biopolymer transport system component
MKNFICTAILFCAANSLLAQQMSTDIYLIDYGIKDKKYFFNAPFNFTNRPGYDNQPSFSKDASKIYYVSYHDSTQSDIYVYDSNDSTNTRLTETVESEFSPQLTADDLGMHVVRVDGDKGQRFYRILMDGSDPVQLLGTTDSVAYYAWINDSTIGVAVLNNGRMDLNIYELPAEQFIPLANNVGRCLAKIPSDENEISYVAKADTNGYSLMKFSIESGLNNMICTLPKGVEDYAWTNDGKLLIGKDGKLLIYDTDKPESGWTELADFSKSIGNFYRIVCSQSGKRMAVVAYKDDLPNATPASNGKKSEEKKEKKKKRD